MNPQVKSSRDERGQSMVEFALGFIIVLMLLAAVADFGRAFFTYLSMRDAAQEGAIFGSICPRHTSCPTTDADCIENRARSSSTDPVDLTDTTNIIITCNYIVNNVEGPCSGAFVTGRDSIQVTVTYNNFPLSVPLITSFIGNSITLRAQVKDTILRDIPAASVCP